LKLESLRKRLLDGVDDDGGAIDAPELLLCCLASGGRVILGDAV
jgi:hypothetical protein